MTVISLSLFYCLFAVLETARQLNCDHVLRDSEVNNHLSGFPSLASNNNPRLQSNELYKDQGRALKSLSQWRINSSALISPLTWFVARSAKISRSPPE